MGKFILGLCCGTLVTCLIVQAVYRLANKEQVE